MNRSIVLVITLFSITSLLVHCPETRASDWPQFLGPNRDGVVPNGPELSWPEDGPEVLWQREVGQGFAGPVVADGKLILFHRLRNQEVITCLKAADGEPLWEKQYRTTYTDDFGFDEGPRSTPLIADGNVFTLGAAGDLSAWKLSDGTALWSRNIRTDFNVRKGYFGVACSPMLAGDRLLINVGGKGAGVVAFDPTTGKEIWKATDDEAGYSSPTMATLGGKPLAVFLTRQGLLVLDPKDGSVHFEKYWRARLAASVNGATPLVRDQEIFLSASYQTGAVLLRVEDDTLSEVWSDDETLSNHYNTSILTNGNLFGIHGRQEYGPELRCVEWKTGKVLWKQPDFGCAFLVRSRDRILATVDSGDVVLFEASPKAFEEVARARLLSKPVRAAPALANGRLYIRDEKKLMSVRVAK